MYRGPAPPAGKPHLYHFVVYALDAALDLPPRLTRAELLEAMKGHIIGQGEIVPIYERKPLPSQPAEIRNWELRLGMSMLKPEPEAWSLEPEEHV